MKKTIRNGALTLSLIAGLALIAAPTTGAMAKSIQRDGYFGGTWAPMGPSNNRHVTRYNRYHDRYGRYGPRGYAYDAPRYGYYDGPYHYGRGPGVGFGITIR